MTARSEAPSGPPRALLLDLDGTIADTLPHVFDAFRHAAAPWVEREPTDAEVEATFGPAERECLAALVPRSALDEAERRYHAYYESELGRNVRVVEGIIELIHHARRLGWRVGVFTSKSRRSAEFTLAELGLGPLIDHLVSSDDVSRTKPDPEGVRVAAEALGVPAGRVLMAGDSPADVSAGRGAGARTAVVLWAAFRAERLRQAGADYVCERVEDLEAAIDALQASG
jgi:HAD superfamily hydrolase (TIGR01509 family)